MKKRLLVVFFLVLFAFLAFRSGTYENNLRWPKWWASTESYYGHRLSHHDKSVVEAAAEKVDVHPSRVILTLLCQPTVPNSSHWEGCDDEERFGRISVVQASFRVHRGVAYRLTHRGHGSSWQWLIGQNGVIEKSDIARFETRTARL